MQRGRVAEDRISEEFPGEESTRFDHEPELVGQESNARLGAHEEEPTDEAKRRDRREADMETVYVPAKLRHHRTRRVSRPRCCDHTAHALVTCGCGSETRRRGVDAPGSAHSSAERAAPRSGRGAGVAPARRLPARGTDRARHGASLQRRAARG